MASYQHFLEEAEAPCLQAGAFIDHALTCDLCKEVLVLIGKDRVNHPAIEVPGVLNDLAFSMATMKGTINTIVALLDAIDGSNK